MTSCHYCQSNVDPDDVTTYRRVIGWERKALDPNRRGGSDVSCREQLDEFACPVCVERLRSGLNINQEALL